MALLDVDFDLFSSPNSRGSRRRWRRRSVLGLVAPAASVDQDRRMKPIFSCSRRPATKRRPARALRSVLSRSPRGRPSTWFSPPRRLVTSMQDFWSQPRRQNTSGSDLAAPLMKRCENRFAVPQSSLTPVCFASGEIVGDPSSRCALGEILALGPECRRREAIIRQENISKATSALSFASSIDDKPGRSKV